MKKQKGTTKAVKLSTKKMNLKEVVSEGVPQMSLEDYHNYKLIIPLSKGTAHENLNEVIYVEIKNKHVHIIIDGKLVPYILDRTMAETQPQFPEPHFQQVHESYVANLHYVEKYLPGDPDTLVMKGNKMISVSRARKETIVNALKAFSKTIPPKTIRKKKS
jgi:two-component system, LytTR family, response regulator